ncbi:sulfate permease, SulP family, partial [Phenoliferia sp. Uapishka_3]
MALPPLNSPSSPPASAAPLRRSQSKGSNQAGASSFRASLGGKAIGPRYAGVKPSSSSAGRRESSSGSTGGSSFSDANEHGDPMKGFGSFSATREELRDARVISSHAMHFRGPRAHSPRSRLAPAMPDPAGRSEIMVASTARCPLPADAWGALIVGSARLAALSLSSPSPLPSPTRESPPVIASSSATTPPQKNSSFPGPHDSTTPKSSAASPFSPPPSRTRKVSATRPGFNFSPRLAPSPSNLSLARPLGGSEYDGTSAGLSPDHLASLTDGGEGTGSSPETDDAITPTQSKMGSMTVPSDIDSEQRTPTPGGGIEERMNMVGGHKVQILGDENGGGSEDDDDDGSVTEELDGGRNQVPNEHSPLLAKKKHNGPPVGAARKTVDVWIEKALSKAKGVVITKTDVVDTAQDAVAAIPAVILGTLMNILDGVSYGMIMFPTNIPVFANFGGIGVSMFFVSCLVSQIVYTGGGSIFKGGNGSMMIEVVPFYHVIVGIITATVDDDKSVVATTMVAFALSSILTGLAFYSLGAMKLGRLSEFFPRHILVGCIGGVGAFLFITGLQVSARLEESEGITADALLHFFDSGVLLLWVIPLILAVTLRLITSRWSHPLIFPGFFLAIPVVFYAIAFALGQSVPDLRGAGWVFEVNGVDSKWYEYWTLYDLKHTDFGALVDTIPTQVALVFFGLLHVPINVPALGISVGEDNVDTDRELVAHGISNVLAGVLGTVPNYLCYVNSVLFYKVGGTTRISGFLLALASFGVLIAGPGVIGYLPVCVVGALIFILGLDLVKEAVWDTYGRVARFEYVTIWAIIIVMTVWDFVMGIGVGIILACVSFVVSSSQRRAVRSILNGAVARSTVRRHPKQSAFLKEVGRQTRIMKLQGFLFFGTISACEATVRKILEAAAWSSNPIRFLVLDFSMASGVDFSAAEAFVRMQRLLEDKGVTLVLCGCPIDSSVGLALRSVDLWVDGEVNPVKVFENLNDALEHCENAFLRSLFSKDFDAPQIVTTSGPSLTSQIDLPKAELDSGVEAFENSPRATHLRYAAKETMTRADAQPARSNFQQPMPLLLQSLRPFSPDMNEDVCFRLAPYFKRVHIERGTTLWTSGSETDSFYLIESGMLRASYLFLDQTHSISESMVAGTAAGEMTFLSRTKRNATVVAERDSVLWKMEVASHEDMGKKEGWAFCRRFEQCLMRVSIEEQDVLMGHLISSL